MGECGVTVMLLNESSPCNTKHICLLVPRVAAMAARWAAAMDVSMAMVKVESREWVGGE